MSGVPSRGYTIGELKLGMTASDEHVVTAEDVAAFAAVSGDHNPVHLDEAYAKTTRFKGRIAHGMLVASFISTVLAAKLPGPGTIYLGQTLSFKAPVRLGDRVETRVTVSEVFAEKGRAILKTQCRVGETVVLDGEATILAPQ